MKIFLSERKKKKKKTRIFCVVREKKERKKNWLLDHPTHRWKFFSCRSKFCYLVPVTHNLWFDDTVQSCFCVYKLDFSKKMLEKGGIFEGSTFVFGRKSIIVIVHSWFFSANQKKKNYNIFLLILYIFSCKNNFFFREIF